MAAALPRRTGDRYAKIFGIDETEFRQEMEGAGALVVSVWGNGPGDRYGVHSHPYRKVLGCLEGSIVFHLPEENVELGAGQRLTIDPETPHSATVGPGGVRCAEARFDT
jgi:quercetin dioxygenase-like cupin family protein